jgi:hypothetical protein
MRVERGEATTQDYVEKQYLGGVVGGGGGGQTSRIMFKLTNIYTGKRGGSIEKRGGSMVAGQTVVLQSRV